MTSAQVAARLEEIVRRFDLPRHCADDLEALLRDVESDAYFKGQSDTAVRTISERAASLRER